MKKKLLFLPLLAALALTGCSNDEAPMEENGDENTNYGYVAVNIVQSKSNVTRDASDGFEYGSDDENEAKEGLFFIFDDATDPAIQGAAQRIKLNGKGTGNTPEVERVYNAVLVIDGVKEEPSNAKQIVCVLNAPENLESGVSKLSDLESKIDDYAGHTAGFIMSNSVYKDGENKVLGAKIESSKIARSASVALNNPVDIYVERVVAKIRSTTENFSNTGANPAIDGETKNLKIKITGIEIANIAEKAYLFKNVDDIDYTWVWNDTENKRSYWETVPGTGTLTFKNKSYDEIVTDSKKGSNDFDINDAKLSEYVQPNTSAQKTAVLVTAQLVDDNGQAADLAYIRGGYTTKDGAKKVVAQYLATNNNYWKKIGEGEIKQLEPDDFVWKNNQDDISVDGLESYEVVAQVNSTKVSKVYDQDGNEISDGVNKINTLLQSKAASAYRARVFTEGKCYYFVNIDQTPITGQTTDKYEGVVRNHIYDLTLQSIKGIGTPVFDPTDKIIPERTKDEDSYYLAARINVLAWRIVNQNVNFDFE